MRLWARGVLKVDALTYKRFLGWRSKNQDGVSALRRKIESVVESVEAYIKENSSNQTKTLAEVEADAILSKILSGIRDSGISYDCLFESHAALVMVPWISPERGPDGVRIREVHDILKGILGDLLDSDAVTNGRVHIYTHPKIEQMNAVRLVVNTGTKSSPAGRLGNSDEKEELIVPVSRILEWPPDREPNHNYSIPYWIEQIELDISDPVIRRRLDRLFEDGESERLARGGGYYLISQDRSPMALVQFDYEVHAVDVIPLAERSEVMDPHKIMDMWIGRRALIEAAGTRNTDGGLIWTRPVNMDAVNGSKFVWKIDYILDDAQETPLAIKFVLVPHKSSSAGAQVRIIEDKDEVSVLLEKAKTEIISAGYKVTSDLVTCYSEWAVDAEKAYSFTSGRVKVACFEANEIVAALITKSLTDSSLNTEPLDKVYTLSIENNEGQMIGHGFLGWREGAPEAAVFRFCIHGSMPHIHKVDFTGKRYFPEIVALLKEIAQHEGMFDHDVEAIQYLTFDEDINDEEGSVGRFERMKSLLLKSGFAFEIGFNGREPIIKITRRDHSDAASEPSSAGAVKYDPRPARTALAEIDKAA